MSFLGSSITGLVCKSPAVFTCTCIDYLHHQLQDKFLEVLSPDHYCWHIGVWMWSVVTPVVTALQPVYSPPLPQKHEWWPVFTSHLTLFIILGNCLCQDIIIIEKMKCALYRVFNKCGSACLSITFWVLTLELLISLCYLRLSCKDLIIYHHISVNPMLPK